MGDDYNVYNTFDSNFINYGELYKTPRDMKMKSKELIGDYADALIKGKSDVYKNSPDLVGNRYFINTNTLCLNKDDNSKTETRSVLVDSVMTSAMSQAKGGNTGLIYSLIASLKTLDTGSMFSDMSNNQPTSYFNSDTSTDYLSDIYKKPLPLCSEITVYSNDEKNDVITGWVTDQDMKDIDPKSMPDVKEGFINVDDYVGPGLTPDKLVEQSHRLNAASQQQAETITKNTIEKAKSKTKEANEQIKKHNEKGKASAVSAASDNMKRVKKNRDEQSRRSNKAMQTGQDNMLKMETAKYLSTNKPTGGVGYTIFELLTILLNMTYECGKDITSRIPAACVNEIFSRDIPENEPSIDANRSNLCSNIKTSIDTKSPDTDTKSPDTDTKSPDTDTKSPVPDQKFKEISIQNFVDELVNSVKENQDNTNKLTLPGLPDKQVCVRVEKPLSGIAALFGGDNKTYENKYIDGSDYKKYEDSLESFRPHIAKEIVRYRNVSVFGHCKAVANKDNSDGESKSDKCEGFTDQLLSVPNNNLEISFTSASSYFFMITLLFLFFYIVYRFTIRFFDIEKVITWKSLKMKK